MPSYKFGTDGWRAVIAEDYTFDAVRALSQATADYLLRHGLGSRPLVIGYDTRFLSGSFAAAAAEVLAANDIHVALSSAPCPTPAVSHALLERGAAGGIVITASHNPARWNGFKLKSSEGRTANEAMTAEIEQAVAGVIAGERVRRMPLGEAEAKGLVDRFDPRGSYIAALRGQVDIEAIRNAGLNVIVDSMYGAAAGYTAEAIGEGATHVHELHGTRNPSFPGMRAPEPIAVNLGEMLGLLQGGGYDLGVATDGDGDRLGVATEDGTFVTQLQAFALLVRYMLEIRGDRGPIVRSITTTRMVERLGERYGCAVHETPVGFKYLGEKMVEVDAMIAGEESGGYAFHGHIPERDGILSGLMLLEYVVKTGKRPAELLADLYAEIGPHEYDRVDVTLKADEREEIESRVAKAKPTTIAGILVEGRDTIDGFRFLMEGGWWLLLRFSGTEPLLRIYAEMPSMDQVHEALQLGQEMAGTTL